MNGTIHEDDVPENVTDTVNQLNAQNNITLIAYVHANGSDPFQVGHCNEREGVRLAFSTYCQYDRNTIRPTHGGIGICVGPDTLKTQKGKRVLLHEILHILLRSSIVGRGSKTLGCADVDQDYQCEGKTFEKVLRQVMFRSGACSSRTRILVTTPTVKEEAQKHFRSSSVEGAQIVTKIVPQAGVKRPCGGVPKSVIPDAHWWQRLFPDEIMTPAATGGLRLSYLTLGLLHDVGWYEVDMTAAEHMEATRPLGHGDLVAHQSCREVILYWRGKQKQILQQDPAAPLPRIGPYCDSEYDADDRVITSHCYNDIEPLECRRIEGTPDAGCGLVRRPEYYGSFACTDTEIIENKYPPDIGATVGNGTICLSIGPIYVRSPINETRAFGLCVEYHCNATLELIRLILKPYGNQECTVFCPRVMSNKVLTTSFAPDAYCNESLGTKFQYICPDYDRVCPEVEVVPFQAPGIQITSTPDNVFPAHMDAPSNALRLKSGGTFVIVLLVASNAAAQ